jgi:hypothetical protein
MIELKFTGPTLESVLAQVRAYLEGSTAPKEASAPEVPQPAKEAPASVAPKPAAPEPVEAEPAPAAPAPAEGALTYVNVRDAVLRLSMALGRPGVEKLLATFGADKNAQEIDPSRYPEVLSTIEDMMKA